MPHGWEIPEETEADLWPEWQDVGGRLDRAIMTIAIVYQQSTELYCDDMILVMLYKSLLSTLIIPMYLLLKH